MEGKSLSENNIFFWSEEGICSCTERQRFYMAKLPDTPRELAYRRCSNCGGTGQKEREKGMDTQKWLGKLEKI